MSWLNGRNETPKFRIVRIIDDVEMDIIQFPETLINGIKCNPHRKILAKNNFDGSLDHETKGYNPEWWIDYEEGILSEVLIDQFKRFVNFADKQSEYFLYFYPNTDTDGNAANEYYNVLWNDKDEIIYKLVNEGKASKVYEGFILNLKSRFRIPDFTNSWKLINPDIPEEIGYPTGEGLGIN
jgi:hypothetical protein